MTFTMRLMAFLTIASLFGATGWLIGDYYAGIDHRTNPQQLYHEFNSEHYGGTLPKVAVIRDHRPGAGGYTKFAWERADCDETRLRLKTPEGGTVCIENPRVVRIGIDPDSSTYQMRQRLLHEVVHVYMFTEHGVLGHGPAFVAEAKRIGVQAAYITPGVTRGKIVTVDQ